jgi:hypothetical protein
LDLFIECNILVDNIKELFILGTLVIARLGKRFEANDTHVVKCRWSSNNRRIVETKVIGGSTHEVFQHTGKNSIILFIFGNHEFTGRFRGIWKVHVGTLFHVWRFKAQESLLIIAHTCPA